ncbi:hypothetical protein [Actinoplanes sp. NPDC049265]|uniref:hypothetical protein n=1 Tax=Actinoplanes sp. NPDC049265 TaxID=3363902 RepID=UPI003723E179
MRLRQFPVGTTPRLELAHPRADALYALHPITTPRPPSGTAEATTTCGTCHADVPLRLSSAASVLAHRRHQFLIGVTIALLQVTVGALLIILDLRRDWGSLPAVIGFLTIMLTFFTAGPPLRESREADGTISLDPAHTLREPGHRVDVVDSDGGNYEAGL